MAMIICKKCGWEYDPEKTCCRCATVKEAEKVIPVKVVKPKKKQ